MQTIVQKLPLEIVQNILEFVDRKELYDLLYICRDWYPLVRNICLRSLTWSGKKRLKSLQRKVQSVEVNGNYIQKLQILPMTRRLCIEKEYVSDYEEYDEDYFENFFENCYYEDESDYDNDDDESDKDTVISVDTSTQFSEHQFWNVLLLFPNLQYLDLRHSLHADYYMKLLCSYREPEKLPLLENIDLYPRDRIDANKDFRALCFATQYLFRRSLRSMNVFYNSFGEGSNFMKSIHDFKCLRRLHTVNVSDPNLTFFHLLQEFPHLSSIGYESKFPVPANAKHQLTTMLQNLEDQNSSMSQFLKNLERIELHYPKPVTPYTNFFADHCPQNLKKIVVNLSEISNNSLDCDREAALILDLCKSLQKFKSVQLIMGKKTILIDDNQIDSFFQILNTLTGEKEFHKHSAVYTFGGDVDGDVDGDISVDGSELSYSCQVDRGFRGEPDLPVPSDIQQLAKVDNFTVDFGHKGEFRCPRTNYLQYAQMYFPRLKHFQVKSNTCNLFRAECLDSSAPSLKNMTSIMMHTHTLSESEIHLLTENFPKIEVLNLSMYKSTLENRISFMLSKFESLHTLIIDVLCDYKSDEGPFFLKFTDSKGSLEYLLDRCNPSDKTASRVESIPLGSIDKRKSRSFYREYGVIRVVALHPLAKIEVNINNSTWATLDLSNVTRTRIRKISKRKTQQETKPRIKKLP